MLKTVHATKKIAQLLENKYASCKKHSGLKEDLLVLLSLTSDLLLLYLAGR